MSNHFVITGRLGDDIELRYANGKAVANGRVADTPRRRDESGNWVDAGETLWLGFSIWDAKAEALAEAARKGDLVTVVGELVARSWDAQDGTKRTVNEIKAREVAVVPRAQSQPRQPQGEPWAGQQAGSPGSQTGAGGWGGGNLPAGTGPSDQPPFAA